MNLQSVLRRVLAYGHWDLLQPEDVRIVPRDRLISLLSPDEAPEQWLIDLLADATDADVKVGILTDSILQTNYQTLFFSEAEVFQRHIEKEELPLLSLEDQMRIVLITSLSKDPLELKPSNFWLRWVKDSSQAYN